MLPVYADLWLHKSAPMEALNHALEEALDDLLVPASGIGRAAKTPVNRIGLFGGSLDLGQAPQRRKLPDAPALRLDALVTRLSKQHGGQVLLLLDEVQALGDAADADAAVSSLRAVLHKRRAEVCAVFTGSPPRGVMTMEPYTPLCS